MCFFPRLGHHFGGVLFGCMNMKATDSFYYTQAWKQCREAYTKYVGGLCERCYRNGVVTPGEIVHHKIHLTPKNMNDPSITLNFDNLELLCRDCHGQEHSTKPKRFKVDSLGRVKTLPFEED